MCVLCGELVSSFHWSDVRFGSQSVEVGTQQGIRLKSRLKKVKFANQILSHFGLSLREWNNSKYLLSNKTGRQEIVNDMGDLWDRAAALLGRKIDILEPNLLLSLKHGKD